jgi:hypothetical protein
VAKAIPTKPTLQLDTASLVDRVVAPASSRISPHP